MRIILVTLFFVGMIACNNKNKSVSDGLLTMSPEKLMEKMISSSDIVLIADHHFIKDNVDYVTSLVPYFKKSGIKIFFSEFLLAKDSALIDELMMKPQFDDSLARVLSHNMLYHWGYQEYIDQMKAFWEINHLLPKTEWIRLMGSMHKLKWEIFQTDEDWSNPIKRKEWEEWDGMPYEKRWAKLIAEYSIERNQKGIVFAGLHHSTTEFHQPIVINGKFQRFEDDRMGNFLYKKYGKRVKLIALHYPWFDRSGYNGSYVIPFHGKLDSLAEKSGYPFGIFSEQQSILDSGSVYSQGFNPLDISNLCDGYIVVAPICKQKVVTVIPNFVHSGNLNESKRQEYTMRDSKFTVKSFNDSIQSWVNDIEGRLKKICELKH